MIAAKLEGECGDISMKETQQQDQRPNLLFVFADQMRGFDMGCAGNPDVQTPNLDRLAAEGALLDRSFANCPVCTPSRAILLTGRYPLSNRVVTNDLPLPDAIPTFGELTRDAGYRTGYIGKWHLDGVPREKWTPPGPRRHGFDEWAVWNCAHRYFEGRYYGGDSPEPIAFAEYEPVGQTDLALAFLQQNDPRPFCLFLSWGPPHDPYEQVPDEFKALYSGDNLALRGNVSELKTAVQDPARRRGARAVLADYYAAITALDAQLGRLLDALREQGKDQNTIVVFTSDHGDMLFSQGMLKKQQPWEEAIRIPFVARWPGHIAAGSRPDTLLSTVDFAPTLLSFLGIAPHGEMQGADLSGALRGDENTSCPPSVLLMEMVTADEGLKQELRPWRGLRTARYTYARWWDGSPWLLYDNDADPLQTRNLIGDAAYAPAQQTLDAELDNFLARTGDCSLPPDQLLREYGLAPFWNEREKAMHGSAGKFL